MDVETDHSRAVRYAARARAHAERCADYLAHADSYALFAYARLRQAQQRLDDPQRLVEHRSEGRALTPEH